MLTDMRAGEPTNFPKWRRQSPDDVEWVVFGNEYIAYHRPSGKTHFLNAASQILICDILAEPKDFADIAEDFASGDTDDHPEEYFDEMLSLLDRLEALGLVERL